MEDGIRRIDFGSVAFPRTALHVRREQEPHRSSLPINIEHLEVCFSLIFVTSLSKRRAMGFYFMSLKVVSFFNFVTLSS